MPDIHQPPRQPARLHMNVYRMSSYRPLSIPTVACRIWSSSIINHKLLSATTHKCILPDVMHGFMPGKSCMNLVLVHTAPPGRHAESRRGQHLWRSLHGLVWCL
jgi:hypothetical protein